MAELKHFVIVVRDQERSAKFRPRSSLEARNSSARIRTNSPRRGAGTLRQASKAFAARPMTALASCGLVILTGL
jgi:hypothetical protein